LIDSVPAYNLKRL